MCFIKKLFTRKESSKKNKIHPGSYSPKPEYKVCSREIVVLERKNTLLN